MTDDFNTVPLTDYALMGLRAAKLQKEIATLKAEYAKATGISEDDSWVFDVPGDDKACVMEFRLRWLRAKVLLEKRLESPTCMEAEHGGHPTCPHMEEVRASLAEDVERLELACEQYAGELRDLERRHAAEKIAYEDSVREVERLKARVEDVEGRLDR